MTFRPTACQTPSPAIGGLARGLIAEGAGRCPTRFATRDGIVVADGGGGIAPFDGAPPTAGWWWEYQTFSIEFTIEPPPCVRTHSAPRLEMLLPRPGSVSAFPSEIQTGVSTRTSAAIAVTTR